MNQNFAEKITIAGNTATPTDYIEMTADAGASFVDDDSLPLRINASNFARIATMGPAWQNLVDVDVPYTRINKLQFDQQRGNANCVSSISAGFRVSQCIIYSYVGAFNGLIIENCLVLTRATNSNGISLNTSGTCEYCTSVHPFGTSSVAGGIRMGYGTARLQNSTSFGFDLGLHVGAVDGSSSTNATDVNTQKTGTDLVNVPYLETTPFVDAVYDGGEDFKLATSSPLEAAGNPSANGINIDIYGNPRDATNPSIGCFEPQAAPAVDEGSLMLGTLF